MLRSRYTYVYLMILNWAVYGLLLDYVAGAKYTLLDTTTKESLNWISFTEEKDSRPRGWREASYTDSKGDVFRVYTVCDITASEVNNWLRTPFIPSRGASRLYIDVSFSVRKCSRYPEPGLLQQCKEVFKLLYYEAEADFASGMMPTWDEDTYKFVDVIAADHVFTDLNQATINYKTRSIAISRGGVYFAFRDQGACITLLSIQIYYIYCPQITANLAVFESTATGPELSSVVQKTGVCVANSLTDDIFPSYLCKGDGKWNFLSGSCRCAAGYEPSNDMSICSPCAPQMYKWNAGNDGCRPCPSHSLTITTAATYCRCSTDYFRGSEDDPTGPCTKPPGEVQNLTVLFRNQTDIVINWQPPSDQGGRSDVWYMVECLGCDGSVVFDPPQNHFNATRVALRRLQPFSVYTVKIYSGNAVSSFVNRFSVSTVTVSTTASVAATPPGATNLRLLNVGANWVTLTWEVFTGQPLVRLCEIKYWAEDQLSHPYYNITRATNVTIGNLRPQTKYYFVIRSKTDEGWNDYSQPIHAVTTELVSQPFQSMTGVIAGSAVAIVVCIIIIIVMIIIFARKGHGRYSEKCMGDCDLLNNSVMYPPCIDGNITLNKGLMLPLFTPSSTTTVTRSYVDPHTYEDPGQAVTEFTREIDASNITIESVIGGGEFGDVCRGKLRVQENDVLIVAIKTLKPGASEKSRLDFLSEASVMGQFDHPNVIFLEGVVTKTNPVMIVTEFMANGSLDGFLRRNDGKFTSLVLVRMIRGISSGMQYLAEMGYVHRDLAARNILVNENLVCKVSDFGLSREIEHSLEWSYTVMGGKIPVRWTAPEAISFRKYSTASDVWSFGIVIWEVMSYGERPYYSWTNQEVIKAVEEGFRLPAPMDCPEAVYRVMKDCWQKDRFARPKFDIVTATLDKLLQNPELLKTTCAPRSVDSLRVVKTTQKQLEPVEHFLEQLQLPQYSTCFRNAGYTTAQQVALLCQKDLVSLGVNSPTHQKRIMQGVQAVRECISNEVCNAYFV